LEYYFQIGTYYDGDDILKWTSTGISTRYLIETPLLVGTYYIQVRAFDNLDYSSITQQILNVTSSGDNHPPTSPTAIYPDVTSEHQPLINWTSSSDPDGDTIRYFIRIGTVPNTGNKLGWTQVNKDFYTVQQQNKLEDGIYFVQLLASDGEATSEPHEEMLKIASFSPELTVQQEFTVKQGSTSTAFRITLMNNCSMDDNITLKITGELLDKASVTLTLSPRSPIHMTPQKTKDITITIGLPSQITIADYKLEFQAISEDDYTKSLSHEMIFHVTSSGLKPNGNDGDGRDGDGGDGGLDLGTLLPILIILIVVIVVLVAIAAAVSKSKNKKTKKQKDAFQGKEDEYENLYGPKKEY